MTHMRKMLALIALACLILPACKKETQKVQQEEISGDVKDKIFALGFSPGNIQLHPEGYLVEGDIVITPEQLNSLPGRQLLRIGETEQYHTFNLVTAPRVITISIDSKISNHGPALDEAISRYNAENLLITFQRVSRRGNIVITKAPAFATYLASAGFPSATGNPYPSILLNTSSLFGVGGQPVNTVASILAHEIGHCIGFRHTDWMDRSYSCGGSPTNEGQETTGVGAVLIPGTPSSPDAGSWMLSCIGSGQNRPFNTNDKTALGYLY